MDKKALLRPKLAEIMVDFVFPISELAKKFEDALNCLKRLLELSTM